MSIQYNKNFGKVIKSLISGRAAEIIAPIAAALTSDIKAATPTLTGETRDSIKSHQHSKFGHTISTTLEKARHIEYGTEDTLAVGMFRKTFDSKAVSMAKRLETDFKTLVEQT
jgi:hypothetical protein